MTETIGEAINGFESIKPRHVRGNEYRVLSWRNGSVTAYQVNIKDLSCTCEDQQYNNGGHEICDHLAVALFAAPKRISETETAPFYLAESVDRAEEAAEQAEDVADGLEDALVRTREEQADQAAEPDTATETQASTGGVDVDDVRDWLESGFASPELVSVYDGTHNGEPGVVLEPDNQAMPDHVYESFKGIVNSLNDSSVHVGFGDDPCMYCGNQDGEFFYHVPADDTSEVWQ